ncbi:uncharacterized protein LOC106669234 isoform X2 [Cimex lectularius]|uniref:Uncharacterized protein n=1 Tax=Cimex lectularius TaxID=79782 RepID=A0A8I6SK07_CIMLE|nr:uncharacterized protein LOC106669234 isoform X2 [Cimex lectularius]
MKRKSNKKLLLLDKGKIGLPPIIWTNCGHYDRDLVDPGPDSALTPSLTRSDARGKSVFLPLSGPTVGIMIGIWWARDLTPPSPRRLLAVTPRQRRKRMQHKDIIAQWSCIAFVPPLEMLKKIRQAKPGRIV